MEQLLEVWEEAHFCVLVLLLVEVSPALEQPVQLLRAQRPISTKGETATSGSRLFLIC